jgi:hypothetical protein
MKIKATVLLKSGDQVEVELPGKRIVCPRCEGKGTHVNPSIDGHGISAEEFAEDPDFEESYFSGLYDVRCEECDGRNVIEVVDESKLTKRMLRRLHAYQDSEARDRAEIEFERRWLV